MSDMKQTVYMRQDRMCEEWIPCGASCPDAVAFDRRTQPEATAPAQADERCPIVHGGSVEVAHLIAIAKATGLFGMASITDIKNYSIALLNEFAVAPAQDLSAAILAIPCKMPDYRDYAMGSSERGPHRDGYRAGHRAALESAAALASSANALSAGDRVDAGEQIKEILSNLQRWELDCEDMIEHATGRWVNYWDIHPIIFAPEGEAVAAILQSQKAK